MKMTKDMAQELACIHNLLANIPTAGDNTVKMSVCLTKLRDVLMGSELLEDASEEAGESDD